MTLDGTKIKANASGNTFRRKEKIEAHLDLARKQVRLMEEQAAEEERSGQTPGSCETPRGGGNGAVAWSQHFAR